MAEQHIEFQLLGQAGVKIHCFGKHIYVDPYLSNSVAELVNKNFQRLTDPPMTPSSVTNADWVLITHDHMDHCDPKTLPQLAKASPKAHFLAPKPCLSAMKSWGIDPARLHLATDMAENMVHHLTDSISLTVIPAAHPTIERDLQGHPRFVGFVLNIANHRIYLSGDTSANFEVMSAAKAAGPLHTAFLPVNEANFFRDLDGIIGNMSLREAFGFATEIGCQNVVPVHWDLFDGNEVTPQEIEAVYRRHSFAFHIHMIPPTIIFQ